jgi:hypothetical protein
LALRIANIIGWVGGLVVVVVVVALARLAQGTARRCIS